MNLPRERLAVGEQCIHVVRAVENHGRCSALKRRDLAPETQSAFDAFSCQVFAERGSRRR